MKKEKEFKEESIKLNMGQTHWNRVMLGFAGGILFMGGVWAFSFLQEETKMFALIPLILGILSAFYGRHG